MHNKLEDWGKELLTKNSHFYIIDFDNIGDLIMPIRLDVTYADKATESIRIPANIWRKNTKKVSSYLF
jgi:hypothetical protein